LSRTSECAFVMRSPNGGARFVFLKRGERMTKILLEAVGIEHSFGTKKTLDIDQLKIYDGERIGLIGENGAGKSTLLAVLSGELMPERGTVRRYAGVSRIRQMGDEDAEGDARLRSIFSAVERREGLSGGERTRRRIAAALSGDSHLLLADEPTTDLDARGVEQLRAELENYEGAIVLVSHDRALLNSLCTRILHLEDARLTDFSGNYSEYRAELERRRAHQKSEYDQYRAEQARLRSAIQSTCERTSQMKKAPSRMGNSEARLHKMDTRQISGQLHKARRQLESRLGQMEVKERPREDIAIRMELGASHPVSAKNAMEIRYITLKAGERSLLSNASLTLPTGSRTALLGPNGCGKTTLMRAIAAKAESEGKLCVGFAQMPAAGSAVRLNPAVRVGWFDQTHERTLNPEKTVLENVLSQSSHPESDVRTVLARMGLRGDNVFKQARVLSGGERGRVALAKLLLSDANLLLLDEPTNHLDIFTLEALQSLLLEYRGTVLFVSHDSAFCDAVATRSARFEGGKLTVFEGSQSERMAHEGADRQAEDIRLEISVLQMRMATLAGRMAAPHKGDDPAALNAEYLELGAQVRELQGMLP